MRVAGIPFHKGAIGAGLALIIVGLGVGSCTLDKSKDLQLSGPSDLGISVELRAMPDVVNADGVSQSVVELVLRNEGGTPVADRAVEFDYIGDGRLVPSADSIYVGPIQTGIVMATDQNGVARVVWVAGFQIRSVFVFVRPYGTDATYAFYRSVEIFQQ